MYYLRILIPLILFFDYTSYAETVRTRIVSVDVSSDPNEPVLYLIESEGRVLKSSPEVFARFNAILLQSEKHEYELVFDSNRWIQSIRMFDFNPLPNHEFILDEDYSPTLFTHYSEASRIFSTLNPRYRNRSQCYNRAQVWSYEMLAQHQVYSMKVFLFFTRKYIREYDWSWWFHVSPYVYVKNERGDSEERVMDYRFMKDPSLMKTWTDYFMRSKTICPTIEKYSDYTEHEEDQYCYLIKAPMYYWQPRDLELREKEGKIKTGFVDEEVSAAYRQGF